MGNRPWQTDAQGRQYWDSPSGQRHYRSEQSAYIGYNSNNGANVEINGIGLQNGRPYINSSRFQTQGNVGKPNAYSRNTARTANDIAQGGMTKDEVVEFNIRHPNETAGG